MGSSTFRRVLAALCIAAITAAGVGLTIMVLAQLSNSSDTPAADKPGLVPPEPSLPTPQEFQIGVEVTDTQCADNGVCTYTYSIKPNYTGFHQLPEQAFTVFYDVVGGLEPQPGNFSVSGGQARVFKDVKVDGPPGAQLQANVTKVSANAGPMPAPAQPEGPPAEIAPQPIS